MEDEIYLIKKTTLTKMADVIRAKTGGTQTLTPDSMAEATGDIENGVELPELTNEGSASDLLAEKQLIDADGNIVEGTIPTKTSSNLTASGATVTVPAGYYATQATKSVATATQATPSISVSTGGLITASATYTAGYVTAGTKSATKQLTTQAAQTITPGTTDKTIASGRYLTGTQTIKGDANLVAGNIKSGVSIFGVSGSYEGSGGGTGGGTGGGEVTPPTPSDGKTRVYIHLEYGRTSPMMGVCPKGTVTVDWGDGTEPDILTGTSTTAVKWTPTHNYAEPGDYVIALTVDGNMGFYGSSTSNERSGILRYTIGADTRNIVYQNAVKQVEIGDGVTSIGDCAFYNCHSLASVVISDGVTSIGNYAFGTCESLASVVIPDSVTYIGNYAFSGCYSLSSITIPDGVTSIGDYAFYNCHSLASVVISDGVTSIGNYAFGTCDSLASVVIPDSVTYIGSGAFSTCYGVRYYDFTACTSVPSISEPMIGISIQTSNDCELLIPAALYDEWITATNWSKYLNYMVAV